MAENSSLDASGYRVYLEAHERTTRTPLAALAAFAKFADGYTGDPFSTAGVVAYATHLKARDLSARTRATYLAGLLSYYLYAVRTGVLTPTAQTLEQVRAELRDLLADLSRTVRKDPLHKRLPSADNVRRVLDAVCVPEIAEGVTLEQLRAQAVVMALASTAARVSELSRLRWRDVDRESHSASVKGKGGKSRTVYFSDAAWNALERYTLARFAAKKSQENQRSAYVFGSECRRKDATGALSARAIQRIVERAAKAAGVWHEFHLTPHTFRHYVATRFLAATGNLAATQDLLGHASPATTRVYAAIDEAQLRSLHRNTFG